MRWFLPFAVWYVLCLAQMANSAWELAHGDMAFGVPSMCVVLLLLGWTLWRNWLWDRSAEAAARATVEQLLRERVGADEGAWLCRDSGVRLAARHRRRLLMSAWTLGRADADQADEIAARGRAPMTVERYIFANLFPRVPRFTDGAMVTMAGDVDHLPAREPGLMWVIRLTGLTGKGKGAHAFADTAELVELAGQLRAAEPA